MSCKYLVKVKVTSRAMMKYHPRFGIIPKEANYILNLWDYMVSPYKIVFLPIIKAVSDALTFVTGQWWP